MNVPRPSTTSGYPAKMNAAKRRANRPGLNQLRALSNDGRVRTTDCVRIIVGNLQAIIVESRRSSCAANSRLSFDDRYVFGKPSRFCSVRWDHEPPSGETAPPRCCQHLAGSAFLRLFCRQDAVSTLRFMESPLSFFRMHWDHEPVRGTSLVWSPGFSRPKTFKPPKGGTPNQPRFMESPHDFVPCLGTMNLERAGRCRQQGAADVSSAELFSDSSAGKMPAAPCGPWKAPTPSRKGARFRAD